MRIDAPKARLLNATACNFASDVADEDWEESRKKVDKMEALWNELLPMVGPEGKAQ